MITQLVLTPSIEHTVWQSLSAYTKLFSFRILNICPASSVQLYLLDALDRGQHTDLRNARDKLTKKMGREVIQLASKGKNNNWKMRQDYDTPCFTIRIEEVLRVR
ncbi:hypothetical protein AAE02nite_31980 [Adhaeribacter aerolatus]|uniref:DUF4113 domain-containing protein n=1 Tax=Adhaeribacter aerolatus TaxID=670289 RepID=A0A512B0P6_9BACT|nr:hypothetical protein AAE02nite_31980 [Adhaeribacter aerolatus]